jgi:mannosyl-3-phosphoglycerate phosphatase
VSDEEARGFMIPPPGKRPRLRLRLPSYIRQIQGFEGYVHAIRRAYRGWVGVAVMVRHVLFADPDGADAPAGEHREAASVLRTLEKRGVVVVLCSTRTRAEVEELQHTLELAHPFIAEGGSAAFIPEGYFSVEVPSTRSVAGYQAIEFGRPYDAIVRSLRAVADRTKIEILPFADMSVEDVARECGLSLLQARLAKLRDYAECFRVLEPDELKVHRMCRALESAGLHCLRRDPFIHVSASSSYAAAMGALRRLYEVAHPGIAVAGIHSPPNRADVLDWVRSLAEQVQQLECRPVPPHA